MAKADETLTQAVKGYRAALAAAKEAADRVAREGTSPAPAAPAGGPTQGQGR
jgi:hypothetical protein